MRPAASVLLLTTLIGMAQGLFLALLFPAPAVLLLFFPASQVMLPVALALQYAGLLAERWYFFAEANHPQNLYYQAIG
ncbi:MAG TPA: hypothetical protein VE935_18420 [Burkholderiales bacterium]|nr:hypothetical protein [Burkholderiales bacterium]